MPTYIQEAIKQCEISLLPAHVAGAVHSVVTKLVYVGMGTRTDRPCFFMQTSQQTDSAGPEEAQAPP
jgi:hypothetical protein